MSGAKALETFLDFAGLPECADTLREFGVERVDDLKSLGRNDLTEFGLDADTCARLSEAAKKYVPDAPPPPEAAADDGDIKSKLAAIMVGGGGRPAPGGRPKPAQPAETREAAMEHVTLNRASAPGKRKPTRSKRSAVAEGLAGAADAAASLDTMPLSIVSLPDNPTDTPRTQASKLSAWLAAGGLEEIEPMLVENGVALLEDLQALGRDDLEALGLNSTQLELIWECINGDHPVQVLRTEDGQWTSTGGPVHSRGRQVTISERFASQFTGKGRNANSLSVSEKTPTGKGKKGKPKEELPAIDSTPRSSRPSSAPPRASVLFRLKKLVGILETESLSSLRTKAEAGNAPAAIRALELKPSVAEVQRWGCRALANAAEENDAQRTEVADGGGAAAAVRALKALPGSRAVEMQALRLLANLASGAEACQLAVMHAGGAPEAVRLLDELAAKEGTVKLVVQQALRTVANLACGTPKVKQLLLDAAVGPAVRKAMDSLPKDLNTQRFGCAAFANLAGGEEAGKGRRVMRDAGGVVCVIKAMRGFPAQPGILAQGARALANLATGDVECTRAVRVGAAAWEEAVIELGGAPSVAAAMAAYPRHMEIVGWSLRTMGAVGGFDPESVRSCGGVRGVVRAMQTHPTDACIQLEGATALATMAGADVNTVDGTRAQSAVVDAGGASEVVSMLKRNLDNADLQEAASTVLLNLARGQDSARLAVFNAGGSAALQRAVEAHPESAVLKQNLEAVTEQLANVKPLVVAPLATSDELDDPGARNSASSARKNSTRKAAQQPSGKGSCCRADVSAQPQERKMQMVSGDL